MPKCMVAKIIPYNNGSGKVQPFRAYRVAILLQEGDNFSIYDPANRNELARNLTPSLVAYLKRMKFLIVEET